MKVVTPNATGGTHSQSTCDSSGYVFYITEHVISVSREQGRFIKRPSRITLYKFI